MTGKAELLLIRKVTRLVPKMPAKTLEDILHTAKKRFVKRMAKQTDLLLDREIFRCEARRCIRILEEL